MSEKPHKGRIEQWEMIQARGGPEVCVGLFVGHPEFMENSPGHTSYIVARDGNEIETLNSRYTLGEPYKDEVQET